MNGDGNIRLREDWAEHASNDVAVRNINKPYATQHDVKRLKVKMATFREAREALLLANDLDLIEDEELLSLYDVNTSKNLDIPYWKYDKFDLDCLSDDECKSEFRFLKHDIYASLDVLNLPDKITCPNRFFVYSDEALCMLLH